MLTRIGAVLTFACSVLISSQSATAAVGRTAGQFAVSPTGSAQYSIPIWTPPGPHGIQPQLALAYNSQSGIGPLGVGWSLAGLGAVTRCNKTYAQDTTPAAVALAVSDGYCLNGNRLRLTAGTYGTAGSTYQTEIADFSNLTANGTAGNGPAYFTVQGRNGLIYQYGYTDTNGNGANSQVLASGTSTADYWLLSKVSDRFGNKYVINYTSLPGTAVPNTILWTPTSAGASSYAYKIQFNYTTNAPQSSLDKYVGGTAVTNTQLLQSIGVSYQGTIVRDYFLAYQASPTTARNELKTIQECADSAQSNCLLPTTVAYQPGAAGVSTTSTPALSSTGGYLTARYDLNGDGYADLVYTRGTTWYVAFGTGSGYGTPVNAGLSTGNNAAILIGNLTGGSVPGNSQDGLLANKGGTWWYYTWNASSSSFVGASTGIAYDATAYQYQLADINGDGLPDLVALYVTYNPTIKKSTATIDTRLNTSTGSTASFSSTLTTAYTLGGLAAAQLQPADDQYAKLRRYDFDGDGRDDLVLQAVTGTSPSFTVSTYELISTGTAFTATSIAAASGSTFSPVFFTNWNDDACTDFVTSGSLYISGCNGSVPATYAVGNVLAAMDWDGDGRTDLVVANGANLGVYLSSGAAPGTLLPTSIPYTSTCQYVTMDVNNDGLDDLGCWSQTAPNPLSFYMHNGALSRPDLANSFTDGYGNSVSLTYATISQGSFIWGDQVFPNQNYIGPVYIAVNAVYSDPTSASGGTYSQHFYYAGATINLQGRGFAGFGAQQRYDSRNGIWETRDFDRVFPYTGMMTYDISAQDNLNATPINRLNNTLTALTLDGTTNNQRYFPYVSNANYLVNEVAGAKNGQPIATTSTTYSYDSYGNATNSATTVTDNDTGSPYYNSQWSSTVATTVSPDHGSNWCLNIPTEVDVTNTAPGVPTLTRHSSYTPDYSNCRETQQVIESGSALYKVTTGYGFDAFGNVNSQTVTGVGMTARTTGTTWGTTGQFPSIVTNALGQQTQMSFDPNTGQQSGMTDPNGIATSWLYDGFARKTKETRPDATSTTWAYNSCATAGCVSTLNQMTVVQTAVNTDNSTLSIQNTYLDALDRPLVTSKLMGNNLYDRNETVYDNLGRVHQTVAPCWFNSCTKYYTTYAYDMIGRMTQAQRPISATNSTLQTTTYGYAGRTSTVLDPQNKLTTQITQVTGSVGRSQDHNGYYIAFNHDAFGSVLSVTDSLSNTLTTATYLYGINAFVQSSTDMDRGARSYTVDALGEVKAYTDAKGQSFSATYDALSRPTGRTEPDLTTTWTWGTSASSDNIGKLMTVSTASSGTTYSDGYTYDTAGRPLTRTITLPSAGALAFNYYYNSTTGQLQNLKYPSIYTPSLYRLTANYLYTNGILTAVRDQLVPSTIWWQANTFNPRGQVTEETSTDLSGDPAIVTQHAYDAVTGWVSSIQTGVGSGGAALQNEAYLYDEMGNVTQRQNNNAGLTENFYYDNLYRLDHSTLGGTTNLQMTYDAGAPGPGNITARSDVAGNAAWTYDPTHKHQVTQAGSSAYTYTYDANGNVSTRNGTALTWTSYNYPSYVATGTESASFDYGADRQRWRMIYMSAAGTETTYYATPLFEKVATSSGTDYRHYIYAGNKPILVVDHSYTGTVTTHSLLTDHQGSISNIVADSTGTSTVGESFTAFGNRREASTWTGTPTSAERAAMDGVTRQGYTFQTVLGSMGLNHMNGRVEDAVTGRFLSADPHVPSLSNTQSFNPYTYVSNNPLTMTDPTGFSQRGQCSVKHYYCPGDFHTLTSGIGVSGASFGGDGGSGYLSDLTDSLNATDSGLLNEASSELEGSNGGSNFDINSGGTTPLNLTSGETPASVSSNASSGSTPQSQSPNLSMAPSDDGFAPIVVNATPINDAPPGGFTQQQSFSCGGSTCLAQMGQWGPNAYGQHGVALGVGHGPAGSAWVQTYVRTTGPNAGQFVQDIDAGAPSAIYTGFGTTASYFTDTPGALANTTGTWVAQTSLIQPNGNGGFSAVFTFQWGFSYTPSGATYIWPVAISPGSYQQQAIRSLH